MQGVPKNVITLLEKIYINSKAHVKIDNNPETFQTFEIKQGVRQNDPLSPNIFNSILESVFRKLKWENKSIMIKSRSANLFINNLRFADDIVLIAKNENKLRVMAGELMRESREVGLTMNLSKTKIMTNIQNLANIQLGDSVIEKVEEYKYLGQSISFADKTNKELKIRRANSWKDFWAQRRVLKSKMRLGTKMRIFNSTVLPVMTYRAQTWATTKKQQSKLTTSQYSMLRNILGIRLNDRISLVKIKSKTY